MAIEYKRMQQRVGTYAQYEQYKDSILPNEFVAVTSGSPDTDDGTALYFKNGTDEPKLIVDEDKLNSESNKLREELSAKTSTNTKVDSILDKLGTSSESTIESQISDSKNEILNKLGRTDDDIDSLIKSKASDIIFGMASTSNSLYGDISNYIDKVLSKLGDSSNDTIETQISNALTSIWNEVASAEDNLIVNLEKNETSLSNKVDVAETNIKTAITTSQTTLSNKIDSTKTELSDEIENVREELREKYEELLEEQRKLAGTILREFKALSDELSVGNGSIAGNSVIVAGDAVVCSYAGKDEYSEQE